MRIAFLANPLDEQYAGVHIYTKNIIQALSELDKENEYLIVRSKKGGEFDHFEEIIVPSYPIPGYKSVNIFFRIPWLLTKKKVDIVVEPAHFGPFNLPQKIKRVTVIHDLTPLLFPQHHTFMGQFLQRIFLPSILKNTHHVITNSEYTRQDLIRFFPFTKNKSSVTLLGKDETFSPQKDSTVLKKYGISQPYLLHVGTLEPRKNIITLIDAFNQLKNKPGYNHKLVLVGKKGWKSKSIFQKIEASPFKTEIILPGYVEHHHLPIIYSMAEIFIYPSIYEGFGLPILEAMSCGTPVITSNVSSLPEVGGDAAIYFNPDSSEELANKILELIGNQGLRQKHSERGLIRANQFSWKKAAIKTKGIFEELME